MTNTLTISAALSTLLVSVTDTLVVDLFSHLLSSELRHIRSKDRQVGTLSELDWWICGQFWPVVRSQPSFGGKMRLQIVNTPICVGPVHFLRGHSGEVMHRNGAQRTAPSLPLSSKCADYHDCACTPPQLCMHPSV